MAASVSTHSEDRKTNFVRLYRLVVGEGSRVLRDAFEKQQPSVRLKEELKFARRTLEKKIKNDDQWKLLFPATGEPSYDNFDITLLFVLLKNKVGNLGKFNPPPKGWDEMPDKNDKTQEANFVRIKWYRNRLSHFDAVEIETSKFELWWKNASEAIIALGADKNEIENLKTKPVDYAFLREMQKIEHEMFKKLLEDILDNVTGKLDAKKRDVTTELPAQVPNFIGGEDNVNKVVKLLSNSETNAVLLTGGPGYGKTTIAIEAAHEIAKETAVKFCRLRKNANKFTVLLRQISFLCTRDLRTQTEDDPERVRCSLLKCCMNLETPFVLLLDDIEEILEQHREDVTNLLEEMSTRSNRQIKFLLTSRTELASTTLFPVEKIHIEPLGIDYSVELIKQSFKNSQKKGIAEKEIMNDKLEQVAKLCDRVPLALCIAGALLTDFEIEELIAKLRNNPVKALDDTVSGKSVEHTIATSFKTLDEGSKLSLISLSVFRGAFDKRAAKALLEENCEKSLRFLKARSLLQSEPDGKYLMHSLIQCYIQDILKEIDSYFSHYHETERKYFDYFLQLLRKNTKLYWSKNGCKESIELFNNDRIHTENAFDSFSKLAQSSEVVNKISAEEFERIFHYVKMCVPPNLYESLLRSVLEPAEKKSDVLLQVLVLCQLGNEIRKKSLGDELTSIMNRVNEIRLENKTKFESKTNKQIELYFWNSRIRNLDEITSSQQENITAAKELEEAWKLLEITHSSHCKNHGDETLASTQTLDGFGFKLYKSSQLHDKAKENFLKSLKIKMRDLGNHVLTFYSLKDLADLELNRKNYDEALQHYQRAKEMLEKLNVLNGKEAILFLKNMASCLMYLIKPEDAERTLKKATTIAEENIEGDHFTKLVVKSTEAELYMNMEKNEDALSSAREAKEMALRLGRHDWPKKGKVVAILEGKEWKKWKH